MDPSAFAGMNRYRSFVSWPTALSESTKTSGSKPSPSMRPKRPSRTVNSSVWCRAAGVAPLTVRHIERRIGLGARSVAAHRAAPVGRRLGPWDRPAQECRHDAVTDVLVVRVDDGRGADSGLGEPRHVGEEPEAPAGVAEPTTARRAPRPDARARSPRSGPTPGRAPWTSRRRARARARACRRSRRGSA